MTTSLYYSYASDYEYVSNATVFIESSTTSALLCGQLYILTKVKTRTNIFKIKFSDVFFRIALEYMRSGVLSLLECSGIIIGMLMKYCIKYGIYSVTAHFHIIFFSKKAQL